MDKEKNIKLKFECSTFMGKLSENHKFFFFFFFCTYIMSFNSSKIRKKNIIIIQKVIYFNFITN